MKISLSGIVGMKYTKYVPIKVPSNIPGKIPLTAGQCTLSWEICERILENEVNRIVAVDVARAILCKSGCTMPEALSIKVMMGTEIKPPPTPNNPAINPTTQPSKG